VGPDYAARSGGEQIESGELTRGALPEVHAAATGATCAPEWAELAFVGTNSLDSPPRPASSCTGTLRLPSGQPRGAFRRRAKAAGDTRLHGIMRRSLAEPKSELDGKVRAARKLEYARARSLHTYLARSFQLDRLDDGER
jgi:hypothetical protein